MPRILTALALLFVFSGCERSEIAEHLDCADFRIDQKRLTGNDAGAISWTVEATGCGRTAYFSCSGDRFHPLCFPTTEEKARHQPDPSEPVRF